LNEQQVPPLGYVPVGMTIHLLGQGGFRCPVLGTGR
jgi:hypothetical protein